MVATVDQMTQCEPILRCLACDGDQLTEYLDLGYHALANDFHDGSIEQGEFPLVVQHCQNCYHSQLSHAVNPELMFTDYAYVSGTTSTLSAYFDWFLSFVEDQFNLDKLAVLDLAGNDGSLLAKFARNGHEVLNIDPAANLTFTSRHNGVPTLCEFWNADTYLALDRKYDCVIAMNVLGHVSNPLGFLIGCRNALADGGKIFIQTSQSEWLSRGDWDCVYSEHISYFSALSFTTLAKRAGLHATRVMKPEIHGRSYLWTLTKESQSGNDGTVQALLEWEHVNGFDDDDTYTEFSVGAQATATWLAQVVDLYRDAGYAVCGYGAAAKGMAVLRFAEVALDFIVDDAPLKIGLLTPGTDIPVVAIDHLLTIDEPLCCVILSWNFAPEIMERVKKIRNRDDDVFAQYFPSKIITQ